MKQVKMKAIEFKSFDGELDDTARNKMSGMKMEVENTNPGGHNQSGYNDDGPCLREASDRLEGESAEHKFLVVMSDGQPRGRYSTAQDLNDTVEHVVLETAQKLLGLGLGPGTDHVKNYYPTSKPNLTIAELAETLSDVLEDMILHPDKYSTSDSEKTESSKTREQLINEIGIAADALVNKGLISRSERDRIVIDAERWGQIKELQAKLEELNQKYYGY